MNEEIDVQDIPEPELPKKPEFITLKMNRTRPEDLGWEDPNMNLVYGPHPRHTPAGVEGNLQFVNGLCITTADHPLLAEVMEKYPVEVVVEESKTNVYIDPDTGKEYKSKRAYNAAQRAKKAARQKE